MERRPPLANVPNRVAKISHEMTERTHFSRVVDPRRCSVANQWRQVMGRGILLWLLGIPLPIIILLLIFWH